uniref:Ribosomal protein S16 n=1 Tax=Pyrrosia subfurfuracea TaxID=253798 RepID=A0A6H1U7G8_9MONI|nr:ribosomal protein S16 [Pyrrosia subfurfuracea]QIZ74794.1 ribosomal protein S16 [Pyrrosia subfurfuracea]
MVKLRLKQHDKKQRLLFNQLQLIPNLGKSKVNVFRRLVSTTPLKSKTQSDFYTSAALLQQVAQLTAAICDILNGAEVFKKVGIKI